MISERTDKQMNKLNRYKQHVRGRRTAERKELLTLGLSRVEKIGSYRANS
jgi:hypothetical protein